MSKSKPELPTDEQSAEVAAKPSKSDEAKDGKPKTPQSDAAKDGKPENVTSMGDLPDMPEGVIKIRIDDAEMDPVVVYVNGRSLVRLRVGEAGLAPEEVVDALRNSEVKFTVLEG